MQVMFPYDEILSTLDYTAFALLDDACSLVVYRGDARLFAANVIRVNGRLTHSAVPESVQQVYRSPSFPFLNGKCVGVLDYSGVFHICMRDQYGDGADAVWSTSDSQLGGGRPVAQEPTGDYILQLTSEGELIIHKTKAHTDVYRYNSNPVYRCVWSSLSCHPTLSMAKNVGRTVLTSLQRTFSVDGLKRVITRFKQFITELLHEVKRIFALLRRKFQR
jgi:hypothetical protein